MRISRVIDAVGEYITIPIEDGIQTVGLTISGTFTGTLTIVGIISADGGETELDVYHPDGTSASLDDNLPLDLFADVGGYTQVRIKATTLTSGSIEITANTSSASRSKASSPLDEALTNAQLRADPVEVTEPVVEQIYDHMVGIDSAGNPLPSNFNYYGSSFTYNGDLIQTEFKVIGSNTYTRTYTYNGVKISSSSAWVKS
ncbi:MAG TPA: hypothetical protein VN843_16990 [Anaerolineales bacterium]|nr:hypothetical protein [Anaerolineales bacterium]